MFSVFKKDKKAKSKYKKEIQPTFNELNLEKSEYMKQARFDIVDEKKNILAMSVSDKEEVQKPINLNTRQQLQELDKMREEIYAFLKQEQTDENEFFEVFYKYMNETNKLKQIIKENREKFSKDLEIKILNEYKF